MTDDVIRGRVPSAITAAAVQIKKYRQPDVQAGGFFFMQLR